MRLSVEYRLAYLSLLSAFVLSSPAAADDWPQWLGPKRDSVWRESGIVAKLPSNGPKVLWRTKIAGGYAGPAVADGRVFVTDYVTAGDITPDPNARNELQGTERVLCLDASTGKQLWKHEYPCDYKISYASGPRATPAVVEGKVYVLGAEGDLTCLNVADGKKLWARNFKREYKAVTPMWGFCGHPLVDGRKLICTVGGEGSVAVAFDKDTGDEIWRSITAKDIGYSPPTIIEAGGVRQLLVWDAERINSLDPETGKAHWNVPLAAAYGMSIMAPRKLGDLLYASGLGEQAVMLKLAADRPAAEEVWRGTRTSAVYCVCSEPFLESGLIYGVCNQGQLRAVNVENGERVWETFQPVTDGRRANSGTAFIVKHDDRFFLMNERGELILAKLSRQGYQELGRQKLLDPTTAAFGRLVVWSHPAFANRCIFARNDKEIVCASLAAE